MNLEMNEFTKKVADIEKLFSEEIARQLEQDNKGQAYYYRELFTLVSKALYAYQVLATYAISLKTILQFQ